MSVFAGVGERSREGNDLIREMTESGVIEKTAFVFGQMNEPPGARLRVGLTGLTMAEYFRDEENRDVLLFIDNIFRFTQAGSEVSALLGRMPSRGRLPAEPRDGDGRAPGAHHLDEERLDHLPPGGLRAGRRLHGPGAGDDVRPPRLDDPPRARDRRARHLPGGRSADLDVARPRPEHRRPGALRRRPARRSASSSASATSSRSSRSSASTSCRRRTRPPSPGRGASSASPASRSSWPRSSPAGRAPTSRSRTRSPRSRRSSRARPTRCPSRRSSSPARSRTFAPTPRSWRAGSCLFSWRSSRPRSRPTPTRSMRSSCPGARASSACCPTTRRSCRRSASASCGSGRAATRNRSRSSAGSSRSCRTRSSSWPRRPTWRPRSISRRRRRPRRGRTRARGGLRRGRRPSPRPAPRSRQALLRERVAQRRHREGPRRRG